MKLVAYTLILALVAVGFFLGIGWVQAYEVGTEQGAWLACENAALAEVGSVSAHDFPYKRDSSVQATEPGSYWVRFATQDQIGQTYLWSCTTTVERGAYNIVKLLVNPPLPQ